MNGIRQLLGSDRASLHLSYFVEAVGAQDERLLEELQVWWNVSEQNCARKRGAGIMFAARGIVVSLAFFVMVYCPLSLLVVLGWRGVSAGHGFRL